MNNKSSVRAYSITEYKNIIQAIKTLKNTVVEITAYGRWRSSTKKEEQQNKDNYYFSKSLSSSNSNGQYDDEDTCIYYKEIIKVDRVWITLDNNSKVRFPEYPSNDNSQDRAYIDVAYKN